jgi:hypothetical protein
MLAVPDLPTIDASPRFFARKFPDDPRADVRAQVMARVTSKTLGRGHFASAH